MMTNCCWRFRISTGRHHRPPTPNAACPPADSDVGAMAPVLDHLVGTHHGAGQAFSTASLRIGPASDATIQFPAHHPAQLGM